MMRLESTRLFPETLFPLTLDLPQELLGGEGSQKSKLSSKITWWREKQEKEVGNIAHSAKKRRHFGMPSLGLFNLNYDVAINACA